MNLQKVAAVLGAAAALSAALAAAERLSTQVWFVAWGAVTLATVFPLPWAAAAVILLRSRGAGVRMRSILARPPFSGEAVGLGIAAAAIALLVALAPLREGVSQSSSHAPLVLGLLRVPATITCSAAMFLGLAGAVLAHRGSTREDALIYGAIMALALTLLVLPVVGLASTFEFGAQILLVASLSPLAATSALSARAVVSEGARLPYLETVGHQSHARCLERWIALGVPEALARELAADPGVGAPRGDLPLLSGTATLYLGDLGAGKSLMAERVVQAAVAAAAGDHDEAVPIYLVAAQITDPLAAHVERVRTDLGLPAAAPVLLVVDGADESGSASAADLVSQARVLASSSPSVAVLVTSRPLTVDLSGVATRLAGQLTPEDSAELIGRIAGRPISADEMDRWPSTIRSAARSPLFAVLVGVHLRSRPRAGIGGVPELMRFLIEHALGDRAVQVSSSRPLLELAAAVLDRRGPVVRTDIGTPADIEMLLQTRLVVERGGGLDVCLPMITMWLAAHALAEGLVDVGGLLGDPSRTERWREALEVAFAAVDYSRLVPIATTITRTRPALASDLLASRPSPFDEESPLPPAREAGRRVREAMGAWIEGLGPVGLAGPTTITGTLGQLGVAVDGATLVTGWRVDLEQPEIVDFAPNYAWTSVMTGLPAPRPSWPWAWAHRELAFHLESHLGPSLIQYVTPELEGEALWRCALRLTGRGSLDPRPVLLDQIREALRALPEGTIIQDHGWNMDTDRLRRDVTRRIAEGQEYLPNPLPGPDLRPIGGFVWSSYSSEALLARTRVVYQRALEAYEPAVRTWFPRARTDFGFAALLPARLVGFLDPSLPDSAGPGLTWYLDPAQPPAGSTVEISLRTDGEGGRLVDHVFERVKRERPEGPAWSGAAVHYAALEVFGPSPSVALCWDWLADDLRRTSLAGETLRRYWD